MIKMSKRIALGMISVALAGACVPGAAIAYAQDLTAATIADEQAVAEDAQQNAAENAAGDDGAANNATYTSSADARLARAVSSVRANAARISGNLALSYDRALIEEIGTQESTGHSICCPSFSCAYADAVLDGTVHDHSYYSCSSCTWTDWGGGGSFDRYVGSDEELLREAYDQIMAGKPTVIHVTYGSGEHWIALIGLRNATDPDHLSLENFIALDPWDGAEIVASDRFSLYGDGCEHVSER